MMLSALLTHPASVFYIGALLIAFLPKTLRNIVLMLTPIIAGLAAYALFSSSTVLGLHFRTLTLLPIKPGTLSLLFVTVFIIFAWLANLYALHTDNSKILLFANLYAGSAIGAVLAGDLITLFIFWEIMAITSCFLIWNPNRPNASGAILRYVLVHLTGGLFFFAGLVMKLYDGSNALMQPAALDAAGILIFIGFMVNAAIPPVHAWMADAYPEGTPAGSVYLSCFTSKVAVYAFASLFAGQQVLIWLGAIAAVYGVVYALMENDMRKLLSYHIICQVGYMLCGIGIGNELGINAGAGHAVGNILFKGLLFMATGAMIEMTGRYSLHELGGLFSRNKLVFAFFMIGALAISGLPGLNGYVTKSLLLGAAHKAHLDWLSITLTVVAAGTFLSIALKLAYFAFFGKEPADLKVKPLPINMAAAMTGLSALCVVLGLFPSLLYRFLPFEVHKHIFTHDHILHTLELLLGTFLGFLLIAKKIHAKDTLTLDLDWIYRKGGLFFVDILCAPIKKAQESIQAGWTQRIRKANQMIVKHFSGRTTHEIRQSLILISGAAVIAGFILIRF